LLTAEDDLLREHIWPVHLLGKTACLELAFVKWRVISKEIRLRL
jgi:hypothetical protein